MAKVIRRGKKRYLVAEPMYPSARALRAYQATWRSMTDDVNGALRKAIARYFSSLSRTAAMDAADDDDDPMQMKSLDQLSFSDVESSFNLESLSAEIAAVTHTFSQRYEQEAHDVAARMMLDVNDDTTAKTKKSLKELSKDYAIDFEAAPNVHRQYRKEYERNVGLIRNIPKANARNLAAKVQKAVERGNGWQDIYDALEDHYGTNTRWAEMVATDQLNKAFETISTEKFREAGVTKAQWLHTDAAKEPREYHKRSAANGGLNGLIYDVDKPPIVDLKTQQRGNPGDLPFCRCTKRAIVEL